MELTLTEEITIVRPRATPSVARPESINSTQTKNYNCQQQEKISKASEAIAAAE
jgi:hypothetical protein